MNGVNAVQLFILVWTFTAVCQADDEHVIVSCDDVTGSVGKEVNLTCSVFLNITGCCFIKYKFHYSETDNDSAICRQDVSVNSCEQRNSFTCGYTPTTAKKEQIRFFVQTNCGTRKEAIFTLNTEHAPLNPSGSPPPETAAGFTVIIVVMVGLIIIINIITMAIICKTKPNFTKFCRRQNCRPEDVI